MCAPKGDQEARGAKARSALDFVLESRSGQECRAQPVQTKEDRVVRNEEVIRLKLATRRGKCWCVHSPASVGTAVPQGRVPSAWTPRDKGEEVYTVQMRRVARLDSGGGSRQERSLAL